MKAHHIKPAAFDQLVAEGRLVQPMFYVPAHQPLLNEVDYTVVLGTYRTYCLGKRTIIFCTTVLHAQAEAERLTQDGIPAKAITGDMPAIERDAVLDEYRRREIVLTTVNVMLDNPIAETEAVIIAAPTRSGVRHHQLIATALRPQFPDGMPTLTSDQRRAAIAASGKPNAMIIDLAGNVLRNGVPH